MEYKRPYIGNLNGYIKSVKIDEYMLATNTFITIKPTRQGLNLNDTILVAFKKSRWKFLGELDWYPYYGITHLLDALINNTLTKYAADQQSRTHRTTYSKPINHVWKDSEKEQIKRERYATVS